MNPENRKIPPWWMFKLLLWTIEQLENLVKKLMPAEMRVLKAASGHCSTQIIHAAQTLGILDVLHSHSKTLEQISEELQLNISSLFRFMRGLRTMGIVDRNGGYYFLTPSGEKLCSRGNLYNQCLIMGSYWQDALSRLPDSIKTGAKSLNSEFEDDFFRYLNRNKDASALFDNSMMELTSTFIPALLAEYDFSPYRHVVDVGGGTGLLLYSILEKYQSMEGTLFDVCSVIENTPKKYTDRCHWVSGSFFEEVPTNGDLYLLKLILHDWSDDKCIQILKNCRNAMKPGNKLLLMEYTIDADFERQFVRIYLDLLMMVMLDGKERSPGQFSTILATCGFQMTKVISTRSTITIIEAQAC